jgi:hypothetical protein
MSIIKFIPEEKVFKKALSLVKKAKKNLYLGMIMKEEVKNTSIEYLNLLKRKIKEGIKIKRIGFGNKKEYQKALEQLGLKALPKNFIFKQCSDHNKFQRLLIVDEKEMLFAAYLNSKNKIVFYTKCKPIIEGFIKYFQKVFDSSKFIG